MKNEKWKIVNDLIELAGQRVFLRGEEYRTRGCVRELAVDGDRITAVVYGSSRYRVTVRIGAASFGYECDCPEGGRGRFCKHCVAVGLEYLDVESTTGESDLAEWLGTLASGDLMELVTGEAMRSEGFRERLVLRAARERGLRPDLQKYTRLVEQALQAVASESGDGSFGIILADVESSLRNLIEAGYAGEVADLIEAAPVFFRGAEELTGLLQRLHHESCRRCGIGEGRLAERLLRWQVASVVDIDVMRGYKDLLGHRGLREYDRLVRAEWGRCCVLVDAGERDQFSRCERLGEIVDRWAEVRGDVDLAIAVKSRRMSEASDYLEIAGLFRRLGREDEAIDWARRGCELFRASEAADLYEFLAAEYEGRGEWGEALTVLLALFTAGPSIEYYRWMALIARRTDEWERWRERALNEVQGGTVLVSILIWEDNLQAALREAGSEKCESSILMDLAGRLARTDPAEALGLYRRLVMRFAEEKNGYSYERLIEVLRRMGRIMKKQDRREEFLDYVRSLREKYRRRHSLAGMLERLLGRHARRTGIAN